MIKKRILVVDDEEAFTRGVKANLKSIYNVRVENKGRRVCDAVKEFCPDLILLDVMMPDMDGCQVARELKECSSCQGIPIVFITALVAKSKSAKDKTMVNDYPGIAKPVSLTDLTACIEENLKLKV
ncbi:MAG: response regulator [Candidatus Omnitrophota bacterium]